MKLTTKLLKRLIKEEIRLLNEDEESLRVFKTLLDAGDINMAQALATDSDPPFNLGKEFPEEYMMAHAKQLVADYKDIQIDSFFPEHSILNIHNDHMNHGEEVRTKDYNLEYLGNGRYQLYNHDTQEFSQPYDSIGKVLKELRLELSK